ncbi:MAG: cupin domain-containing protein [Candidatus Caenarcaniphilales bacterium]|nr:cupin domain-containing protein [Candidatus Caenarcaniphilales bacterium]
MSTQPETKNRITLISAGGNLQPVDLKGASNCKMQPLLTQTENAPNFSMRLFELEPGGHTPQHSHPWEHEIFILEGEGQLKSEDNIGFSSSDAILVPANTLHQFYNSGTKPLRFLCLIPNNSDYQQIK